MTITALPAAPSRSDPPATFISKADALVAALALFVSETNATAAQLTAAVGAVTAGTVISIATVFRSSTVDADPSADGVGSFRLNNATQNTATTIYVDDLSSGSVDMLPTYDTFDASTSTVKGQLRLQKTADATKFLIFNVTARTTATGYRKFTIVNIGSSAASPFAAADAITLTFTRTGDVGSFTGTLSNTDILGLRVAAFNSEINNATTFGGSTVNWTLGAMQKQVEPTGIINYAFTAPPGACHLQLRVISDGASGAYVHSWPATVKWLGAQWQQVINKGALINFWYDGTDYWASGVNVA